MTVATRAQIVTFRLGDDLFAADIGEVERVLRYAAPTPVPNVPVWVKGVIEYRSRVVPVIDLRERFELPAGPVSGTTRLMVLSAHGDWVAAVVDAVLEVVPLGASQLSGTPALFRGLAAEFLRGILRRNERLIIVLDVARLLATHDRLVFDTGTQSAAEAIAALAAAIPEVPGDAAPDQPAESPPIEATRIDPQVLEGAEPSDGGPLQLLSTSDEAPRPDQSILGGAPAPSAPVERVDDEPLPADGETTGPRDE